MYYMSELNKSVENWIQLVLLRSSLVTPSCAVAYIIVERVTPPHSPQDVTSDGETQSHAMKQVCHFNVQKRISRDWKKSLVGTSPRRHLIWTGNPCLSWKVDHTKFTCHQMQYQCLSYAHRGSQALWRRGQIIIRRGSLEGCNRTNLNRRCNRMGYKNGQGS